MNDAETRTELHRENPQRSLTHQDRNLQSLREHLTKRRTFLLAQDEIKKAVEK